MTQVGEAPPRDLGFRIELERRIEAPVPGVFDALLEQLGPEAMTVGGEALSMRIEPFPGGRWYRDLGGDDGHLWAHVQAIKRPTLLELYGPLFMSRAVSNNVQYRLEAHGAATLLRLVHEAFGRIPDSARDGMPDGWSDQLDRLVQRAEARTEAEG